MFESVLINLLTNKPSEYVARLATMICKWIRIVFDDANHYFFLFIYTLFAFSSMFG